MDTLNKVSRVQVRLFDSEGILNLNCQHAFASSCSTRLELSRALQFLGLLWCLCPVSRFALSSRSPLRQRPSSSNQVLVADSSRICISTTTFTTGTVPAQFTATVNHSFDMAPKQAKKPQAITLKGSCNLVTEFFKYAANTSAAHAPLFV